MRDLDDDSTPLSAVPAILPLSAVPAALPRLRSGKKVSISTVYRWTLGGCRGVRLRYTQVGATRCTTRRWLDEFFAALTARAEGEPAPEPGTRSPARRARDLARAEREAEALGV